MIEETNTSVTMQRNYFFGVYPERSRRKLAPERGNAFFASRMDLRDYYAFARYYSPRLGRFMSPDPLRGDTLNPQSLNRYTYGLNNPETFTDPLGLQCVTTDNGTVADDGTPPPCNDPSVWTIETVTVHGTTSPYSGEGGLKDYFRLLSEAPGMNGCGILWCTPIPPPDSNLYLLKLPGNLPTTRPQQPQKQTPTIGPSYQKGTPPDPFACSAYLDGTGAGETLDTLCMHLLPWNPNSPWSDCVRGKLLQQYPGNPGSFQFWWYLGPDHGYDFVTCLAGK